MPLKPSDKLDALISEFRKGRLEAFEAIFHQLYSRLCAFSFKYVKKTELAEEIVGDSFIIVWERRQSFDNLQSLKSYLYTTVRNASLDHLKKKGELVVLDTDQPDSTLNKEYAIIEEETHSMLYQALDSLPYKCRRVFEMSCLDGVKYQDIADEMQISLNTVKSQRARAIQLLKDHFKGHSFYSILLSTL